MNKLTYIIILLTPIIINAQIGIGTQTVDNSAILELKSTNKSLLLPQVPLISNTDTETIANPITGLIVLNTNDSSISVPEDNRVYKDVIYHYNGEKWKSIMTDDTGTSILNLPKLYAKGRKLTSDKCNSKYEIPFALTERDNINYNGSIKASKNGFYKYYTKVILYFEPSSQSPILFTPTGSFTFKFRGQGSEMRNHEVTHSGTIYLEKNATSNLFAFTIGNGVNCSGNQSINQIDVIWEYLGDVE